MYSIGFMLKSQCMIRLRRVNFPCHGDLKHGQSHAILRQGITLHVGNHTIPQIVTLTWNHCTATYKEYITNGA